MIDSLLCTLTKENFVTVIGFNLANVEWIRLLEKLTILHFNTFSSFIFIQGKKLESENNFKDTETPSIDRNRNLWMAELSQLAEF